MLSFNKVKMSDEKKAVKKNSLPGEKLVKTVTGLLNTSLQSLKTQLGEKKFNKRIKKAAKMLVAGMGKTQAKKSAVKVKKAIPAKKKTIKPVLKKVK